MNYYKENYLFGLRVSEGSVCSPYGHCSGLLETEHHGSRSRERKGKEVLRQAQPSKALVTHFLQVGNPNLNTRTSKVLPLARDIQLMNLCGTFHVQS